MRTRRPAPRSILGWASLLLGTALVPLAGLTPAVTEAAANPPPAAASPLLAIDSDFPDPDVLLADGVYHAYATSDIDRHVQHRTSADLRAWTDAPDIMPTLADWVGDCATLPDGRVDHCVWAPEVSAVEGGYALYYTARDAASGLQCIGLATSSSPNGPFVDERDTALVCPTEQGGAIDASTYRDGDDLYLLWKADGNCCNKPAILYLQPLSADGKTLTGPPTELIRNSLPWTGAVVEAPTLTKHGDTYYLLFSANDYFGGNYRTGWATADRVDGPYTINASELMTSRDFFGDVRGPGGQDVFTTRQGETAMVFHGWNATYTGRGMYVTEFGYDDAGIPVVAGAAQRYEAESAVITHATVGTDNAASGLKRVGGLDFADSAVSFTVRAAQTGVHTLGIRFANGSLDSAGKPASATHALSVNGTTAGSVTYWHTQWGNWQVLEVPVRLTKGVNTITLRRGTLFAELDALYIGRGHRAEQAPVHPEDLADATRYEAEDGQVEHAAIRPDASASNGAKVGGLDFSDSSVTVRVNSEKGGRATLGVRFANGSERGGYPLVARHAVAVNGQAAGELAYPHTRWGNWNVIEYEVALEPGWNTVSLTRLAWYAEIDAIDVR